MALVLGATTGICYWAALEIDRLRSANQRTLLFTATVGAFILFICFFKLRVLLTPNAALAVPLGISYYTFRLISYIVDVHWGKIQPERSAIRFAAFIAFFPHLVAGPIQRAHEFLPQTYADREGWSPKPWKGSQRILLGFLKKIAVADTLAMLVNYGFAHAGESSAAPSMLAFYLFPLQLYFDFSGLTDIAVGIGLLFGIESPENFNHPFSASNISEFWRRWHISLTEWLRDYVFMPLRMALREWGNSGLVISLTVNMLLIALWHGFRSNYLVFGIIHSAYLTFDVLSLPYRKRYFKSHASAAKIAAILGPVFTYNLVAIANIFFRASSFADGAHLLVGLAAGYKNFIEGIALAMAPPNGHAWAALPFAALAILGDWARKQWPDMLSQIEPRWLRWSAGMAIVVSTIFVALMMAAGRHEANPFLYENF